MIRERQAPKKRSKYKSDFPYWPALHPLVFDEKTHQKTFIGFYKHTSKTSRKQVIILGI